MTYPACIHSECPICDRPSPDRHVTAADLGDAKPVDPLVAAAVSAVCDWTNDHGETRARMRGRCEAVIARLSAVLAAARVVCDVYAAGCVDDGCGRGAPEPEEVAALRDAIAAADGAR